MCGRYANSKSSPDMAALFDAEDLIAGAWVPKFNIAPTTLAPVVRRSRTRGERVVELARWGLVPFWASDPNMGVRMYNARMETVATSKAFKRPFAAKRALIPADGWYEWRKLPGGGKQPYFFTQPGGFVFAGLWETWRIDGSQASPRPPQGETFLMSFTILTSPAMGEAMETIHDRMPYVLPPERHAAWLGEEEADVRELLAGPDPSFPKDLEIRKIGRAVGNADNEGPELVRPVEAEEAPSTIPGL